MFMWPVSACLTTYPFSDGRVSTCAWPCIYRYEDIQSQTHVHVECIKMPTRTVLSQLFTSPNVTPVCLSLLSHPQLTKRPSKVLSPSPNISRLFTPPKEHCGLVCRVEQRSREGEWNSHWRTADPT